MPDFRVIPSNPVVDAVDRRGQNYMLAGPVTTDFSAGVKGLMQGIDFGTTIADRVLTTRRENDPDKLAAEQLRLELQNQQIQEAIRTATIENTLDEQFGFTDRGLDQERVAAGIGQTVATTRKTAQEANLLEQYGGADIRSQIDARNATAGKNAFQTELLRKYGEDKEKALIDKYRAQANKAWGRGGAPGRNLYREKLQQEQGQQPQDQTPNFRRLPEPGVTPSNSTATGTQSPANSIAINEAQLMQEMDQLEFSGQEAEIYNQRAEVRAQNIKNNLASKRASDANTRIATMENIYSRAIEGVNDKTWEGDSNYKRVFEDVAELNAHYKQEPGLRAKEANAEQLSDLITSLGPNGAQKYIDSLEGQEKENAKKILSSAIANSGNFDLYTDEMNVIIGADLDPDHAADPENVYSMVEQLIADGSTNIEDSRFKRVFRSDRFVIAARKASKNGTQPYLVTSDDIASDTSRDMASDQQSHGFIIFIGMDGTTSQALAPNPTDIKAESRLALVEKVASRQQQSIPQQQQIGQTVQGLQQQPSQYGQVAQQPQQQAQGERSPPFFKGLTDESQINQKYRQNIFENASEFTDTGEKFAGKLGLDLSKSYYPTVKGIVDDVTKDTASISSNKEQIQEIETLLHYAVATKNTDYIGPNAKLDQMEENIKSYLPGNFADEDKKRLMDMFSRAQMLAKVAKMAGGNVKGYDTPAEMEALIKGTISPTSSMGTITTLLKLMKAENKQKTALNEIRNVGVSEEILEPAIRQAENAYLASDVSRALIKNPKIGQPGEPDFIDNPDFQDGMTFLGLRDKPKPPTGGGPGGGSRGASMGSSSSGGNTPDVATTPQDVQQADVVQQNVREPTQGVAQATSLTDQKPVPTLHITPNKETSVKENLTPEAQPAYEDLVKRMGDRVLEGAPLERFMKVMSTPGFLMNPEAYMSISPEENESFDKVITGIDYLADSILGNKGEELARAMGSNPQFEAARQTARDEFQKNNKWTALGMDAFGTIVDMILVSKAGGALLGSAIKSAGYNKAKKGVQLARKLGSTSAGTPHALLAGQAALDGVVNALRQEDDSNLYEFLTGAAISGAIQKGFVPIASGMKGVGAKILRLVGMSDPASLALAKKLMKQGVTKEQILEPLEEAKRLSDSGVGKKEFVEQNADNWLYNDDMKRSFEANWAGNERNIKIVNPEHGGFEKLASKVKGKDIEAWGARRGPVTKKSFDIQLTDSADSPDAVSKGDRRVIGRLTIRNGIIDKIGVIPEFQKQGLSKEMMKLAEKRLGAVPALPKENVQSEVASAYFDVFGAPGPEINPLGLLPDEARGTLKGVTSEGSARPGVNVTAADRDKAASIAIEGSEQQAGLSGLRPTEEIAGDFKTTANEVIDEQVKTETARILQGAEFSKEEALADILKTTSDAGRSGQQVVDDIAELLGVEGKSLSEGGAKVSGGDDTPTLSAQVMKQLKAAKEAVGKLLRGNLDNPGAFFRQLEVMYSELDEGIVQKLDDAFRDKENFPSGAAKWIDTVANESELHKTVDGVAKAGEKGTPKIQVMHPSFKYLDNLRQYVAKKEAGTSIDVSAKAQKMIEDAVDRMIELRGGGKNVYSNLIHKQFPKLYEVEKGLQTLIDTGRVIEDRSARTGTQTIRNAIFTDTEKITAAYGEKGAARLQTKSQAYDKAVQIIEGIQKNKGKIDIDELAQDFKEADTLANNNQFFAKKLIEQGSGAINRLRQTLGPKEKGLIEEGVVKVLKNNLDNFKGNVEGENFTPKDMFGLDEVQWKTVKQLVGKEKAELLETMLERRIAIEKTLKIFETDAAARKVAPDGAAVKMAPRRLMETFGEYALDLMSAVGLKSASQKETEAIIKGIAQPPKDVDTLLRQVAAHMQTVTSAKGTTTKLTSISEESMQKARILLYSVWSANQDGGDARSNTAHREALKLLENSRK